MDIVNKKPADWTLIVEEEKYQLIECRAAVVSTILFAVDWKGYM